MGRPEGSKARATRAASCLIAVTLHGRRRRFRSEMLGDVEPVNIF